MGAIRTAADTVFRNFRSAGVPTTGPHSPGKPEIRALFGTVEDSITIGSTLVDGYLINPYWSPGALPSAFTGSYPVGDGDNLPPLTTGTKVNTADGEVYRISTYTSVASRLNFRVDAGETYIAKWEARRVVNPIDPLGDTVGYFLAWLDYKKDSISNSIVFLDSLFVTDGLKSITKTLSLDQDTDIVAPAGACYARPFIVVYPSDAATRTDIRTIGIWQSTSGLPGPQGNAGDLTPAAIALRDEMLGLVDDVEVLKGEVEDLVAEVPYFYEPGAVIQTVQAAPYRTSTALSNIIPLDDTPPANNQGIRVQTIAVKLQRPNSILDVEFDAEASPSVVPLYATASLFLNGETSCRAATTAGLNATYIAALNLTGRIVPGSGGVHEVHVRVGPNATGSVYLNGNAAGRLLGGSKAANLRVTEVAGEMLTWGGGQGSDALEGSPQTGTLATAAPGLTTTNVITPNGATPVEGTVATHRYHHHTRCHERNGRIWVAFTSSGWNEGDGGTQVVVKSAPVAGTLTFGSNLVVVPSQSDFLNDYHVLGSRLTMPTCFVVHASKLYLCSSIDEIMVDDEYIVSGKAFTARECLDNGTLGTLFRITPDTYTPIGGRASIDYDGVLGPPLLAQVQLYGQWGGSYPGQPGVTLTTYGSEGATVYCEPNTIPLSADGLTLIRLWRRITVTATTDQQWAQHSRDGGVTWSGIRWTNIPCDTSSSHGIRLTDGRVVIIGNLPGAVRDPLYLAIFDSTDFIRSSIYYVRQGVTPTPVYAGSGKNGSLAYPCVHQGADSLWVSYSVSGKEKIDLTRIPLSGL